MAITGLNIHKLSSLVSVNQEGTTVNRFKEAIVECTAVAADTLDLKTYLKDLVRIVSVSNETLAGVTLSATAASVSTFGASTSVLTLKNTGAYSARIVYV
jgi:hypothetical protein